MASNFQNLLQLHQNQINVQTTSAVKKQGIRFDRLRTAKLTAAGCNTSNNPVVSGLWEAVVEYNAEWKHPTTMENSEKYHSLVILDHIYHTCTLYMTVKGHKELSSGGGTAKRKLRYEAFKELIQDVTKETEFFGGRLLVGPSDFKEKKRNYWLERIDPLHRAGFMISDEYNIWVKLNSPQPFFAWLGNKFRYNSNVKGYENQAEGAQWEYSRCFDNGKLVTSIDDTIFSTRFMRTEFSSAGWAVFVCSLTMPDPAGKYGEFIFSYTHKAGYDHHSSFLGGFAVMAAGEWIVDDTGKIRVITGKSGHYMPKWENLHAFVRRFPQIPGDAIIRPNMLDHQNGTSTIKYYRVSDFRARNINGTPLKRAVVMNAIQSTGANANIQEHTQAGVFDLSAMLPA